MKVVVLGGKVLDWVMEALEEFGLVLEVLEELDLVVEGLVQGDLVLVD